MYISIDNFLDVRNFAGNHQGLGNKGNCENNDRVMCTVYCIHIYIHTYIHIYARACVYVCVCIYIYIYIYIWTHLSCVYSTSSYRI